VIQEIAGPNIVLVDTGAAVARQLQRRIYSDLAGHKELCSVGQNRLSSSPLAQFFTSGNAEYASLIISTLWGEGATVTQLPRQYI
jgi:glutamate racemase